MIVWVSKKVVLAIHDEQLREHGGASGVRDEGLLESALAPPVKRAGHGEADTLERAALYAAAITKNHPFVDGNKRTAFAVMVTFFALNGLYFEPTEAAAVAAMLALAGGEMDEAAFIAWTRGQVHGR